MATEDIIYKWIKGLISLALVLCVHNGFAQDKIRPYKSDVGSVHQFGFIGSFNNTANPNFSEIDQRKTFHDYGIGVIYNLHDYITKQFTFEVISSVTLSTGNSLKNRNESERSQKITIPIDCRICLGPSEDFQVYVGTGIQWNAFELSFGESNDLINNQHAKSIHQLAGNTAVGLNVLGPQKYMIHFNAGIKLHYAIASNNSKTNETEIVDITKDRSCVILNSGVTIDLDKRKNACLMINYEHPIGNPVSRYKMEESGFFDKTQGFSLSLLFHIGGTR